MIYRLKYTDKDAAIADLKDVGVIDSDGNRKGFPTHNVVFIGYIVDTPAVIEGDEVITPATYIDGYHVDVMDEREKLNFSGELTNPKTPYHKF